MGSICRSSGVSRREMRICPLERMARFSHHEGKANSWRVVTGNGKEGRALAERG